jgi:hypothetical protein
VRRAFPLSSKLSRSWLVAGAVALLAVLLVVLAARLRGHAPSPAPWVAAERPRESSAGGGSPRIRIRNVHMVVMPGVVLEVRDLQGRLEPLGKDGVPVFDNPQSFRLAIDHGTAAVSAASLTALLNGYTFAYPSAPLRGLRLEIHDGLLRQTGTLHKGVDLPFEMEGELSVASDGRLRIHPRKIKAAGLPVKGLLGALNLELAKMIKVRADRGVAVDGNDLLLDSDHLMPPPAMSGRVGSARLEGDRIVLEFVGSGKKSLEPSVASARNYMYFRGGRLRFGKLTMQDTDLLIADLHPGDPFLFNLAQYARQLVAGYSKTLENQGLVSYMPDAH